MKQIETWTEFAEAMERRRQDFHQQYYAMYSSWYGGLVTNPLWMLLPMDDHIVHRGDGVFEAFKCTGGKIYNLQAHLDRLEHSARALELNLPCTIDQIRDLVVEVVQAGGHADCGIRLFVSRGPGGFGVSPYECVERQLYVLAVKLGRPFMELHPGGARVKTSLVPAKHAQFAEVKNCNYLPNVLMKKEAIDQGVDYVMGFDEAGLLREGATENMGIVTPDKRLLFPPLDGILQGTTMMRIMALAQELVPRGILHEVGFGEIDRSMLETADEMLIAGTTCNVVAVTEFDGCPVADGRPGGCYEELSRLLLRDMRENSKVLTPVPGLLGADRL